MENNTKAENTVFILGSGASKQFGLPLLSELQLEVAKLLGQLTIELITAHKYMLHHENVNISESEMNIVLENIENDKNNLKNADQIQLFFEKLFINLKKMFDKHFFNTQKFGSGFPSNLETILYKLIQYLKDIKDFKQTTDDILVSLKSCPNPDERLFNLYRVSIAKVINNAAPYTHFKVKKSGFPINLLYLNEFVVLNYNYDFILEEMIIWTYTDELWPHAKALLKRIWHFHGLVLPSKKPIFDKDDPDLAGITVQLPLNKDLQLQDIKTFFPCYFNISKTQSNILPVTYSDFKKFTFNDLGFRNNGYTFKFIFIGFGFHKTNMEYLPFFDKDTQKIMPDLNLKYIIIMPKGKTPYYWNLVKCYGMSVNPTDKTYVRNNDYITRNQQVMWVQKEVEKLTEQDWNIIADF